jgi:hypothetical protein
VRIVLSFCGQIVIFFKNYLISLRKMFVVNVWKICHAFVKTVRSSCGKTCHFSVEACDKFLETVNKIGKNVLLVFVKYT